MENVILNNGEEKMEQKYLYCGRDQYLKRTKAKHPVLLFEPKNN